MLHDRLSWRERVLLLAALLAVSGAGFLAYSRQRIAPARRSLNMEMHMLRAEVERLDKRRPASVAETTEVATLQAEVATLAESIDDLAQQRQAMKAALAQQMPAAAETQAQALLIMATLAHEHGMRILQHQPHSLADSAAESWRETGPHPVTRQLVAVAEYAALQLFLSRVVEQLPQILLLDLLVTPVDSSPHNQPAT